MTEAGLSRAGAEGGAVCYSNEVGLEVSSKELAGLRQVELCGDGRSGSLTAQQEQFNPIQL